MGCMLEVVGSHHVRVSEDRGTTEMRVIIMRLAVATSFELVVGDEGCDSYSAGKSE